MINKKKDSRGYQQMWQKPRYRQAKLELYQDLAQALGDKPQKILDIGAGHALTSELFQRDWGSELWLLEGDREHSSGDRLGKWGTAESMQYYLTRAELEQHWQRQGLRYTLVRAEQPEIDSRVKFDLVYSWLSAGFHYPASTYRSLIEQHSHPGTRVFMDFRCVRGRFHTDFRSEGITVIRTLRGNGKMQTLEIRFDGMAR